MRIKNDQAGLTLVELLVTIVVASIVTLAACTMLLFGLRINNQSTKTSRGQNTVQVLMEALEDVAAEAKNLEIVSVNGEWAVKDDGTVIFSYVPETQTIYSGATTLVAEQVVGTPFLENVQESYVTLSSNGLLTIDVAMQQGNYSTSVYCRMNKNGDTTGMDIIEELTKATLSTADIEKNYNSYRRYIFLQKLASQYGSKGKIIGTNDDGKYYATWYNAEWGESAAWCACYISWALDQTRQQFISIPRKADVKELRSAVTDTTDVNPGDLIFFDMNKDEKLDHVGAVLCLKGGYVYTIEGNTAGRVGVRKYDINDGRIDSYGVLNWNS